MTRLLDGRIAIITGAGSGVGHAAALLFAQHGARLVLADIDRPSVDRTLAEVEAAGGEGRAMQCDVSDEAAVAELVRLAVDSFGRLDIIYNNVGITLKPDGKGVRYLVDTGADEIDRIMGVNFGGVVNGCKAAVRQFEAQGGGGVIVSTASVAGLIGYGGAAYSATKGAVVALTRTLAIELADRDIRVNSVCPGGMPTRFGGADPEGEHAERHRAAIARNHPLGRVIEPLDCANAALFLASDMARNITGVNLAIDGGLSAGIQVRKK